MNNLYNYINREPVIIISGEITKNNIQNLNILQLQNEKFKVLVFKIISIIEEFKNFDKYAAYCGGKGYKYFKEDIFEINNYVINAKYFPVISEHNFYYFVYKKNDSCLNSGCHL